MKFNFKKVASVLAATIMLGSTVSFAAAAWPAPFVQDGSSAAAVVYGANAPSTGGDKAAAINLGAELDKSITSTVSASTSGTGESFKIEKQNNNFNLGDDVTEFYATLDSEELAKVLADGVYTNDDNDEFDYEQSIVLNNSLTLEHFLETNDDFAGADVPAIGFNLNNGDKVLTYTLEFTDDADNGVEFGDGDATDRDLLETTTLEILGMSYYIQKVDSTSSGLEMTLLDNANDAEVSEGEEKTVAVGDNSYNVKISYVSEDDTILEVNGVKTNKLGEGDVFKIGSDTYVAVKSILYNAKESGISQVEFSIGTGKILLIDGAEVQMNGEAISDLDDYQGNVLMAAFTTDALNTTISEIELTWTLDDDAWVVPGSDLVLPGFETIKLSVGEFVMPGAESTVLSAADEETFQITTELTDGKITLQILNTNETNFVGFGESDDHVLVLDDSASPVFALDESEDNYFVVSWANGDDYESYAFELSSIKYTASTDKTEVVLDNLAEGKDITLTEVDDTTDIGSLTFTLSAANDTAGTATITVSDGSSAGTVYGDAIITKEGLMLDLSALNASNVDTQVIYAIEEDSTNGNIGEGNQFNLTVTVQEDDGAEVTAIAGISTLETADNSKVYEGYMVSDMATKVIWDKPTNALNELEIVYAGDESMGSVYIAEASAAVGAVKDSVKVVTDAEVDSVKSKNLIVVGGSCINTVAASMLGSTSPVCGDSWASQTGTGPGKYLIQVAASPVNAEKIAMLIAGYETADTQNAVAKVKEGDVSTEVGTKLVGPVAA